MALHIARIYYPVLTLGPGRRAGIWTAGCPRRCPGCISPELQRQESGRAMDTGQIMALIHALPGRPEGVTISGGEPFLDPGGLRELLDALSGVSDDILVFTGFTYEALRARGDPDVDGALARCAALVDGPYVAELNDGCGLRGSRNQRCLVFRHRERYAGAEQWPRRLQNVAYGAGILTIGIP